MEDSEQRRVVIECIVLAMSRSGIRGVANADLIRGALDMDYEALTADGKLNLQFVWELLEPLDGFNPANATPPVCLVKTLEPRLGLPVVMPTGVATLNKHQIAAKAAMMPLKPKEIEHIFSGSQAPEPGEITAPIIMEVEQQVQDEIERRSRPQKKKAKPGELSPKKKLAGLVAGLVALASIAFVSVTVVRSCDPAPKWQAATAADFGAIPVKSPRRLGNQVGATVDSAWLGRPEAERRASMQEALERLKPRQVLVLFLQDEQGRPRASAQWKGEQVVIKFF